MIVRVRKSKEKFTVVKNAIINDTRLKESLGLLVWLLSKPDNWEVRMISIQDRFNIGRDKARKWMKELSLAGYARLEKIRDGSGQITGSTWVIYEDGVESLRGTVFQSLGDNTDSLKNRQSDSPTVGKHVDIVNTDGLTSTDVLTNTDLSLSRENENQIQSEIEEAKEIEGAVDVETPNIAELNDLWIEKALSNKSFLAKWERMQPGRVEELATAAAAGFIKKYFSESRNEKAAAMELKRKLEDSVGMRESSYLHSWILREDQFSKPKTKSNEFNNQKPRAKNHDYEGTYQKYMEMADEYFGAAVG